MLRSAITAFLTVFAGAAAAERTNVAVAANFTAPAKEIAAAFAADTGHEAVLSFGSTGKLYAQIANGAPYQVLLAADRERPARAEAEGLAVSGSRFTYAVGKIVLYSTDPTLVDQEGKVLANLAPSARLAIANPKTAPFGAAAVEVMEALGVYRRVAPNIVMGESVGQAYQFVATGNAQLGFIALSQVIGTDRGSQWLVPEHLYTPVRQDAILLKTGADNEAAAAFLVYLRGDEARAIIRRYGYAIE